MSLTQVKTSNIDDTGSGLNFRNRIINGDMRIDQRNAGASVTSHATLPVDRFRMLTTAGGAITGQQVTDAPTGFSNSIKVTVTTAATPSGGVTGILQHIEGYNSADLGMGTSGAKTFTLSFWVKSSISGNFGISFKNASNNRFYLTTYTINTANTWEYKTITVSGDTSGTWGTDSSTGLRFDFDLGTQASSRGSTINAWHTSTYVQGPTSGTDLLSTLNATWQITGVQLEEGNAATAFERRPYGTELALCQRYCQVYGSGNGYERLGMAMGITSTSVNVNIHLPVTMRATPSVSSTGSWGWYNGSAVVAGTTFTLDALSTQVVALILATTGVTSGSTYQVINVNDQSARLTLNSEL